MDLEELVKKAQAGDQSALQEICINFEGLVKKQAFQNHIRPIACEAMAEGNLAVVQAVRMYNPSLGIHFAGFVESRVKYAVWNLFKRERRIWQREMPFEGSNEEGEFDLADILQDERDIAAETVEKVAAQNLWGEVCLLPQKQRQVILRTIFAERSLTEAARELGVTPQAAHNLRKRGLARLKSRCAGMYSSEGG